MKLIIDIPTSPDLVLEALNIKKYQVMRELAEQDGYDLDGYYRDQSKEIRYWNQAVDIVHDRYNEILVNALETMSAFQGG